VVALAAAAGFVATPVHLYIHIYLQAGKLQMKSRRPEFPRMPTVHQPTAKKLQPEKKICNRK